MRESKKQKQGKKQKQKQTNKQQQETNKNICCVPWYSLRSYVLNITFTWYHNIRRVKVSFGILCYHGETFSYISEYIKYGLAVIFNLYFHVSYYTTRR